MMALVSEIHPFADRNGRVARYVMSAELLARDQERISIPTAYRTDFLGALKAFSYNGQTAPLIRMLDIVQDCTHGIDWSTLADARAALGATSAIAEAEDANFRFTASKARLEAVLAPRSCPRIMRRD